MKPTRRNVLLGVGTVTTGTAAFFSTGAFVQEQISRDFTVTVTDDTSSDVQLPIRPTSGVDTDDRVSLTTNADGIKVMTVDATNLPTDSNVTIGNFSNTDDSSSLNAGAFTIENQNPLDSAIGLTISLANTDGFSTVELAVDDGSTVRTATEGGSGVTFSIITGQTVEVGIWISTASSGGGQKPSTSQSTPRSQRTPYPNPA